MKAFWSDLGGKLGVGLCGGGFLLVFLGWNGAASQDRVPAQFPYLISGGLGGLCLVVVGVGLIVVQNQRADRAELQTSLREIRLAIDGDDARGDEPFSPPRRRPTPPEYAPALEVSDTADRGWSAEGEPVKGRPRRTPLRADDA